MVIVLSICANIHSLYPAYNQRGFKHRLYALTNQTYRHI